MLKIDGIDVDHLQLLLNNLSQLLNNVPPNIKKNLYQHLIKSVKLYKDRVEMEITDSLYSMRLDVNRGQNEKFAVTPVLRGGQGAKRTLLKVISTY